MHFQKTILAVLVLLLLLDVGWIFAGVAGATTLDPSLAEIQTFCNVLYIVLNVLQVIRNRLIKLSEGSTFLSTKAFGACREAALIFDPKI